MTSMTPETFIAFVALMDHDPNKAVASLKAAAWPDFRKVSETAQTMADDLTPNDRNIARHAWLFELSLWCDRRLS